MVKREMPEVRYYETFEDDFVVNRGQDYHLPEDYKWIERGLWHRTISKVLCGLFRIVSFFYCKYVLHIKIENGQALNSYKETGCFLYGNHTQMTGDAFGALYVNPHKKAYALAGQANLGIPVLGKILTYIGAIPVADSLKGMKEMKATIEQRIKEKGCIVIYPEAHVWPYYTDIRPFPETSFRYPVECQVPSFCMTTTYQKRKQGDKPKITLYVDGPFYPNTSLKKKEQQRTLRDEIYNCMKERSKNSTYQYIRYERKI